MKFDDVFEYLGDFGTYQKRIYTLLCFPALFVGAQILVGVFILDIPKHRCVIPGLTNDTFEIQDFGHETRLNSSIPWVKKDDLWVPDSCHVFLNGSRNQTRECSEWVYDQSGVKNSVITQLNLVCSKEYMRPMANSILMAGLLMGSLLLGVLSDLFGRRPMFLISIVLHIASGIATAFSPNFPVFIVLRFLNGAATISMFISSYILGLELVGPRKRTFAGMVTNIVWCLGPIIMGGLAYFIRDWHHLQLAISVPSCLLLSYYWLIPESSRWLLSRGRKDEAEKILRKAAEVNGVQLPEKLFDLETEDNAPRAKMSEMFTSRVLLIRTLIIFYQWLVASMVVYGLALNVGKLGGNIYLNFAIGSFVDLASYSAAGVMVDRLGRKPSHCASMLLGGVACLAALFPVVYGGKDYEWATTTLSMIGRFGASSAFTVIYIFAAELFPTVVRNSGMGASSFFARIGGIICPYIADLGTIVGGDFGGALPPIVFGGTAIIAGIISLWLPETLNRKLPETLEDAKNFGKNSEKLSADVDLSITKPNQLYGGHTNNGYVTHKP